MNTAIFSESLVFFFLVIWEKVFQVMLLFPLILDSMHYWSEVNGADIIGFLTTTHPFLDDLEILAYSLGLLELWSKYYSQFTNETVEP